MSFMTERIFHQAINTENFRQRTQVGTIDREFHVTRGRLDEPVQFSPGLDINATEVTVQNQPGHLAFGIEAKRVVERAFTEKR
jgi:hypothetical protein